MTKKEAKEAIEILKPLFEQCKGIDGCLGYIEHYFSKDEEKALDLAIRALEERPQGEWIEKVIELFNKYDILLVHVDGKIVPVKNSSKQECYNLLYEIQELIEWRKLLWRKNNV